MRPVAASLGCLCRAGDIMMIMFCVKHVGEQQEKSSCNRYELDLVQNLSALGYTPNLDYILNLTEPSSDFLLSSLKQEGCKDGWTYSAEHYQSTAVTEVLNHCCCSCYGLFIIYCVFTEFNIRNLPFTTHFVLLFRLQHAK